MDSTKLTYLPRAAVNNTNKVTDYKSGTHLYICDGKGCNRNCAEAGFDMCRHTSNEKHATTKCRRNRKFIKKHGVYVEV